MPTPTLVEEPVRTADERLGRLEIQIAHLATEIDRLRERQQSTIERLTLVVVAMGGFGAVGETILRVVGGL